MHAKGGVRKIWSGGFSVLMTQTSGTQKIGIAGQTVKLINLETGFTMSFHFTDASGAYLFDISDHLATGTYQIQLIFNFNGVTATQLSNPISVMRGDNFFTADFDMTSTMTPLVTMALDTSPTTALKKTTIRR